MALPVFFAQKLCRRMYDYAYWLHTRDISHTTLFPPKLYEYTPKDPEENDRLMMQHVEHRLFGKLQHKKRRPDRENGDHHPWSKSLNRTMFYL